MAHSRLIWQVSCGLDDCFHKVTGNFSSNFEVTSCVGLLEEEPQKAHPMSFTWASLIAASVLTGH